MVFSSLSALGPLPRRIKEEFTSQSQSMQHSRTVYARLDAAYGYMHVIVGLHPKHVSATGTLIIADLTDLVDPSQARKHVQLLHPVP